MSKWSRRAVFHGAVWIGLVVLTSGCVTLRHRTDPLNNACFIRVAVKMRTPSRIVSGVAGIYRSDDCRIRMEIADPVGITHSCIMIDERSIRWIDLDDQCWTAIDGWVNRLSHACGVSLKCSQMVEWVLPSEWPRQPRSIRIERPGNLQLEILQMPPSADELGRVILRIPVRGVEVSFCWIEPDWIGCTENVNEGIHDAWFECEDNLTVMDWLM